MDLDKGFSLIEVLLSLMLTSTVVLLLLQLHNSNYLLVKRLLIINYASAILDRVDENFLLGIPRRFSPVDPYTLHMEHTPEHDKIEVSWAGASDSVRRFYSIPYLFHG